MSSWFNLDSLNNFKGQISNFASEVLSDGIVNDAGPAPTKVEELENAIANQSVEIQSLRQENDDLRTRILQQSRSSFDNEPGNDDGWTWDSPDPSAENTHRTISDLKRKVDILESERADLIKNMEQLDLDCQQTTEKLLAMKDNLQADYNKLQDEKITLERKNEFLDKINQDYQKRLGLLDTKVSELSKQLTECEGVKGQVVQEGDPKLELILEEYERKAAQYEHTIASLKKEIASGAVSDASKVHKKYMDILTGSITKSTDHQIPDIADRDSELSEFTGLVENIVKIILDYKWRCETLDKEVSDLTEEKTKILTEKNFEIEKLIQNSEDLSNEIIMKSQDLKHYEQECTELTKNNDLLISRLDEVKNSSGNLQTISESNEDNVLQLEGQLEASNRRIEELELIITDLESGKQNSQCETETELAYIKNQLNLTGKELSDVKKEYQTLSDNYKEMVDHNDDLKHNLEDMKNTYNECFSEKEDLNTTMDQIKSELENTEYMNAEQNITVETLKEEIETHLQKINELTIENKKMEQAKLYVESQNEIMLKEIEDLKQELTAEIENNEQRDLDALSLSERLENAQSLKPHLETLQTEYDSSQQELIELKTQIGMVNEEKQLLLEKNAKYIMEEEKTRQNLLNLEIIAQEATKEKDGATAALQMYENKFEELQHQCDSVILEREKLRLDFENFKKSVVGKPQLETLQTEYGSLQQKLIDLETQIRMLHEEKQVVLEKNAKHIMEEEKTRQNLLNLEELVQKAEKEKEGATAALQMYETKFEELRHQYDDVILEREKLRSDFENFKESVAENNCPSSDDSAKVTLLEEQLAAKEVACREYEEKLGMLEKELAELNSNMAQMMPVLRDKHQENVNYHLEIQRLQQLLTIETEKSHTFETQLQNLASPEEISKKDEEIEKLTEQNEFLRQKCTVLAENLLQEQTNTRSEVTEKEAALQKKLDTLTQHLLEVEDAYTKEVQQAEQRCEEMLGKLQQVEQREQNSSNRYTSINIRANQQVETLQTQLQLVTNQRDDLKRRMSDLEDEVAKQESALTNLQGVLVQFQREKERDIHDETERIRRQISIEKQSQSALEKEIADLRAQLEESKQGLKAARRLGDQVDQYKSQVTAMKEEVSLLQQQLAKSQEKYNKTMNQTDGKVDKMLIKSLIIGFVCSNNNLTKDQNQILKIISTVLDFNQQEIEKVKLNKGNQNHSWLGSLMHPHAGQDYNQESLSMAFVRFLEAESKPRELPNLLESAPVPSNNSKAEGSSRSSSVRQSPILLNEVMLPTFTDFGQTRNSSSILKDVLKDNTNS